MMLNNINQALLAKIYATSKLIISKYLYEPASLSKSFRNDIDDSLIKLEPELKELL